jgi:hypothetical protein
MPRGDGTGPMGAGPRTGRGLGYCNGFDRPGYGNPAPALRGGLGFRNGGMGRGWRHRFYATGIPGWVPPAPEQEIADFKAQAEWLKKQLDVVQKHIDELSD